MQLPLLKISPKGWGGAPCMLPAKHNAWIPSSFATDGLLHFWVLWNYTGSLVNFPFFCRILLEVAAAEWGSAPGHTIPDYISWWGAVPTSPFEESDYLKEQGRAWNRQENMFCHSFLLPTASLWLQCSGDCWRRQLYQSAVISCLSWQHGHCHICPQSPYTHATQQALKTMGYNLGWNA